MAGPELKDPEPKPDDAESEPEPEPETDGEFDVAMTDTGEVGDPDGFFDGVDADPERAEKTDSADFFDGQDSGSDGDGESDEGDDGLFGSAETGPIAPRANETIAKLGVFGLDEGDEKDDLESEFLELAETVQFGRFTEDSVKKHLDSNFDDIDPVWGMLGAALILAAAIVYKRPDVETEQIQAKVKGTLGNVNVPFIDG